MRRIASHSAAKGHRLSKNQAKRSGHSRKQPLIIRNAPKRI